MNTIIGSDCSVASMFKTMGGWTTQFDIDGERVGGKSFGLTKDSRLFWHIKTIGGIKDKRILELGPLEGAHTKIMIEQGAREIIAVEGLSDCFLRCLVVKEAFQLTKARFLFGDFCRYVAEYTGEKFDIVSAAGVLYHQINPAELIFNLGKITNIVFVWSHVASETNPSKEEGSVSCQSGIWTYKGKINNYGGIRTILDSYCGGLNDSAFWMYPDEMRRCFKDAGFSEIIETKSGPTPNGDCLLFTAKK